MSVFAQSVKYVMQGRAYYDGTSQIYKLRVTDDGSGNIKGENVSILPSGRVLIGPVRGVIDYKRQTIIFQELKIANLPRGESQEDFCFFTIKASFKIVQGKTVINGTFTSKHPSGLACSGGTIYLIGEKDVTEIRKQYVKRVAEEKAKQVKKDPPPVVKPKPIVVKPKPVVVKPKVEVKPVEVVVPVKDTPPPPPPPVVFAAPIIPQGAKEYEYSSDVLTISVLDYDQDDGDKIDLYLNDKPLLLQHTISVKGFTFDLDLKALGNGSGVDVLNLYAVSAGSYAPTSAKFIILDKDQKFTQFAGTNLNKTFNLVLKKKTTLTEGTAAEKAVEVQK
jgi:hypothetical protein